MSEEIEIFTCAAAGSSAVMTVRFALNSLTVCKASVSTSAQSDDLHGVMGCMTR